MKGTGVTAAVAALLLLVACVDAARMSEARARHTSYRKLRDGLHEQFAFVGGAGEDVEQHARRGAWAAAGAPPMHAARVWAETGNEWRAGPHESPHLWAARAAEEERMAREPRAAMAGDPAQCDALVAFFEAMGGPEWTSERKGRSPWQQGTNCCHWYGVRCTASDITSLDLPYNNLAGELPGAELAKLPELIHLFLQGNHIRGGVPAELGTLQKARYFALAGNDLEGHLPELHNAELQYFSVQRNSMTGTVPSSYLNMPALTFLELGTNRFTGELPPVTLDIEDVHMQVLYLSYNEFVGGVPASWEKMNHTLAWLVLSHNRLDTTVPAFLGEFGGLTYMMLHNNALHGTLPASLGRMHAARYLTVNNNALTGTIPAEYGQLAHLEYLLLYDNELTGNIPPTLGNAISLRALSLYNNALTGPIPAHLSNLRHLYWLGLNQNYLSGTIPAVLGALHALEQGLDVSENDLTGVVPPSLGALHKCKMLRVNNNRLVGELPPELFHMRSLEVLDIANNGLSGGIPHTILNCTSLRHLDAHDNHLSGGIPDAIGNDTALEFVDVSHNALTELPATMRNLLSLAALDVSFNRIVGTIPAALFALEDLSFVDFSYNLFYGALPFENIVNSGVVALFAGHNHLEGTVFGLERTDILRELDLSHNAFAAIDVVEYKHRYEVSASLSRLHLAYNDITTPLDALPLSTVFPDLFSLDLSHNPMTGEIPGEELSKLPHLGVLRLDGTNLRFHNTSLDCLADSAACLPHGFALGDACSDPRLNYTCYEPTFFASDALTRIDWNAYFDHALCECNEGFTGTRNMCVAPTPVPTPSITPMPSPHVPSPQPEPSPSPCHCSPAPSPSAAPTHTPCPSPSCHTARDADEVDKYKRASAGLGVMMAITTVLAVVFAVLWWRARNAAPPATGAEMRQTDTYARMEDEA